MEPIRCQTARIFARRRHDPIRALALVERCLSFEPDHMSALDCLGEILESQGKLEDALVVRQQRLSHSPPGYAFALVHLGKCQARLGNQPEAETSLLTALDVVRVHRCNPKQTLALCHLVKTAMAEFIFCNEAYHQVMNGAVEICLVHSDGEGGDQLVNQAVSILLVHAKRIKKSTTCTCFENNRDAQVQILFEKAVIEARAHSSVVKRAWDDFKQKDSNSFFGGESLSSSSTGGGNHGGASNSIPYRHKLRADNASTHKNVRVTNNKQE